MRRVMFKNVKPISLSILFLIGILTLTVSVFSENEDLKFSINYPKATESSCFKFHENEIIGYNITNAYGVECPGDIVIPLERTIRGSAFFGLDRVNSVTIHGNIKRLKAHAFAYSGIKFVTFHEGLEIIEEGCFSSTRLTVVNFSESLRIIHAFSFEDNEFRYLNIPDNVILIGSRAFQDNTYLTTVTIGCGIREIKNGAFLGTSVHSVCIRASQSNVTVASNAFPPFATIKYDCTDENMFPSYKLQNEKPSEENPSINFVGWCGANSV